MRDFASIRGLYLLHYTNMTLRLGILGILLLRCEARVPIDLSVLEDMGSRPMWQAWLGHISLGSSQLIEKLATPYQLQRYDEVITFEHRF